MATTVGSKWSLKEEEFQEIKCASHSLGMIIINFIKIIPSLIIPIIFPLDWHCKYLLACLLSHGDCIRVYDYT